MRKRRAAGPLTWCFIASLYVPTLALLYAAVTTDRIHLEALWGVRLIILLLFTPIILKYAVHLFIAPWYPAVERVRRQRKTSSPLLSVSVLVPAWNEEVGIRATLRSICDTRYPNVEIVVINDGSTDGTHGVITAFIAEHARRRDPRKAVIRYERVQNGGKAKALNAALSMATGDIIVTIDSDSVMDRDSIRNMVKRFDDPRVASVAGNVVIGNRSKPIGLVQQLEYLYGFYFKRADSLLNAVYIVGGAAAAYRRKIVVELGGFDETIITEDIELSTRLQDRGYLVRYAADAVVYTEGPSDLKGLCRQRLRWKFGRLLTFYKYRRLFFSVDKRHNLYLTFLILPIALFSEALLFFEGVLLTVFYAYTFYTNDFWPLLLFILLLAAIISMQIVFDSRARHHLNLLAVAPGAWLLFYFMDFVEYQALLRSLWCLLNRQKPAWQRWTRVGVFGA